MASLLTFPKNSNGYPTTKAAAASLGGSRIEACSPQAVRHGGASLPFAVRAGAGASVGNFDRADLNPESVRKFVDQIKLTRLRNVIPLHARTSGRSGRILMTVVHAMGAAIGATRGSV